MKTFGPKQYVTAKRKHARFVIDGDAFMTMSEVYGAANRRGFVGDRSVIYSRVQRGATSWAEILKPVNAAIAEARRASVAKKHAEMAAVIAALDARKAGAA